MITGYGRVLPQKAVLLVSDREVCLLWLVSLIPVQKRAAAASEVAKFAARGLFGCVAHGVPALDVFCEQP